jgi:YVTN family beta-propeller protein
MHSARLSKKFSSAARLTHTQTPCCKQYLAAQILSMVRTRRWFVDLVVALSMVCALRAQAADQLRIYVSDEDSGEITIVDPGAGQVVERISVGKRPRGVKLAPDGKRLYVALSGSPSAGPGVDESKLPPSDRAADGIGIVDLATLKLLRTLPSGQDPEAFDLSRDGKTIFISNEETAEVTVLNVATGKVTKKVPVGKEPGGVTVRPDGKFVYVTCEGDSEVVAINAATLKVVSHMHTELRPRSVVFTKDGSTAFATAERGAAVTVIDGTRHKAIGAIKIPSQGGKPLSARPMGSVLAPDGRYVFVSNGRGGSVAVIDVASRKVVRMIDDVGNRPWGIGVSPDGKYLYTANGPSDDVSVIDVETGLVKQRIKVGGRPWGLVLAARP